MEGGTRGMAVGEGWGWGWRRGGGGVRGGVVEDGDGEGVG